MSFYAPRIKSICLGSRERGFWNPNYATIGAGVFSAIEHAIATGIHPGPFLPQLQSITFSEDRYTSAWDLLPFLTTVTYSLTMNMKCRNKMDETRLGLQTVLSSLSTLCPAIRNFKLRCEYSDVEHDIISHFSKGLHKMQTLSSIYITQYLITSSMLQEISVLPKL